MKRINRLKEESKSVYSYYVNRYKGYSEEEAFERAIGKKSKNVYVEIDGVTYPIKEAMKLVNCKLTYSAVMKRIKRGMTPLEAISKSLYR